MQLIFTVLLVIGATAIVLNLNRWSQKKPFSLSQLPFINVQAKYQMLLLAVALTVLVLLYLFNPMNFARFLALGNPSAPAAAVALFGIAEGESWLAVGGSLTLFITLATATFTFLQFRKLKGGLTQLMPFTPHILLFSLSNCFAEEVIYRLGVIVPLAGAIKPQYILILSAIAFGAPHLRGMPNGIVGALMAGVLGWLLAKSALETGGMFWAWTIHFVQDIVIFSGLVLSAIHSQTRAETVDVDVLSATSRKP